MKIHNTIQKTITVIEQTNLKELFEFLEIALPNKLWEKYSIESSSTATIWTSPITIPYPAPIQPYYPSFPWITCSTDGASNTVDGIFNVMC